MKPPSEAELPDSTVCRHGDIQGSVVDNLLVLVNVATGAAAIYDLLLPVTPSPATLGAMTWSPILNRELVAGDAVDHEGAASPVLPGSCPPLQFLPPNLVFDSKRRMAFRCELTACAA